MAKKHYLALLICFITHIPSSTLAWKRHDLMTSFIVQDVSWLSMPIKVTSFEQFLAKAFSKDFTKSDFLNQYQLNPKTVIGFKDIKKGETTSASAILIHYSDEPDRGMDQDLNLSPDQKYMGGYKGPTSQGFRHLYFKKWSMRAPWRTFHVPMKEMGEALKRAQIFYDLAETAYNVSEPYWAFRFLAWSLHYVQDLGQPYHSSQILTPRFLSWEDIFHFKQFVSRTTQIISNCHYLYEDYAVYRLKKEISAKLEKKFIPALRGADFWPSSSAFLIARHAANFSNHDSTTIGNLCYAYFGRKFLDPSIDLPRSPQAHYPIETLDKESRLTSIQKKIFLETTTKNLKKTAYYSRSLIQLAREEFLKGF
jgi:hypothetical protein